jgi:PTH1 family peptidyl-tRNA hydrolase
VIKLIVGLGNPGQQYEKTRHNVGFLFLDQLAEADAVSWSVESKFHGEVANYFVGGNKVMLLKPQTFMNRSGLAVGSIARYYKFKAEDILIIHDELDLSPAIVKLKKSGGHAGHNGLRDIMANLGEKDFYRLRLGIGRPSPGKKVADYVLSNPARDEKDLINLAFDSAIEQMKNIVSGDIAIAMNTLNKA